MLPSLRTLLGTVIASAGIVAAGAGTASAGTASIVFSEPGEHRVVIPPGVTSLDVVAVGGRGGEGTYQVEGGFGARVTGTLAVTPGQVLYLQVGGNGESGVNKGGAGAGGGASDVRTTPASAGLTPTDPRLLIAGGGGGSGRGFGFGATGSAGYGGNAGMPGGAARAGLEPMSGGGGAGVPAGTGAGGTPGAANPVHGEFGQPGTLGAGGDGAYIAESVITPARGGYNGGGDGGGFTVTLTGQTFILYGGGGGGGGLNGGGGGGGVDVQRGDSDGGGGGGGGSNLVPAGGSAATDTTGAGSITLGFADDTEPVVALDAVPARVGWSYRFEGDSGSVLGDGAVTLDVFAGPTATGTPVASETASRDPATGDYDALFTNLGNGQFTVRASQVDGAGNVGTSTARTFVSDTSKPVISLASPGAGALITDPTPTFTGVAGTAAFDSATVTVKIFKAFQLQQTLTGTRDAATGAYALTAPTGLADGTYDAVASQSDDVGNLGTGPIVTFSIDSEAPAPSLTGPPAPRSSDTTPSFVGTGSKKPGDADAVDVRIFSGDTTSGAPAATLNAKLDGSGRYQVDAAPLADGTYTAQTAQLDAAGNVGRSTAHTFTVDTAAPAVTLTAPAAGSSVGARPRFTGTGGVAAGDARAVTVTVYSGSTQVAAIDAPLDAIGAYAADAPFALAAGTYTAVARQGDDVGNVSATSAQTFTVDPQTSTVDAQAPALRRVGLTAKRGARQPRRTLRYSVSEPATLRIVVRRGSKRVATVTRASKRGKNRFAFGRRIGGKALKSGRYTLTLVAIDAAGNRSPAKRVRFRVA